MGSTPKFYKLLVCHTKSSSLLLSLPFIQDSYWFYACLTDTHGCNYKVCTSWKFVLWLWSCNLPKNQFMVILWHLQVLSPLPTTLNESPVPHTYCYKNIMGVEVCPIYANHSLKLPLKRFQATPAEFLVPFSYMWYFLAFSKPSCRLGLSPIALAHPWQNGAHHTTVFAYFLWLEWFCGLCTLHFREWYSSTPNEHQTTIW